MGKYGEHPSSLLITWPDCYKLVSVANELCAWLWVCALTAQCTLRRVSVQQVVQLPLRSNWLGLRMHSNNREMARVSSACKIYIEPIQTHLMHFILFLLKELFWASFVYLLNKSTSYKLQVLSQWIMSNVCQVRDGFAFWSVDTDLAMPVKFVLEEKAITWTRHEITMPQRINYYN